MATIARGHIEKLPSGSFRVHVYGGTVSTREAHEGYIRCTIGPVLGEVKIRKLGADSLQTALKKCSRLCRRLPRTEHYSATRLLAAGTDLNTVAGRLGHAEGSTTQKFYAQFTRPADQRPATVSPSQLDGLHKKERLRELYGQHQSASAGDGLTALASVIGPQAGLNKDIALAWLTEFAAPGRDLRARAVPLPWAISQPSISQTGSAARSQARGPSAPRRAAAHCRRRRSAD